MSAASGDQDENQNHVVSHLDLFCFIIPYKHIVRFIRHMQTAQTHTRRRIMQSLIRIFNVCVQNVLFSEIWKKLTESALMG